MTGFAKLVHLKGGRNVAISVYYSAEELGLDGARAKAKKLRNEYGYRIVSIKHCQIPKWGQLTVPYAEDYSQTELGYKIIMDTGDTEYTLIME